MLSLIRGWFNIKTVFNRGMSSVGPDTMTLQPSFILNGISCTGNTDIFILNKGPHLIDSNRNLLKYLSLSSVLEDSCDTWTGVLQDCNLVTYPVNQCLYLTKPQGIAKYDHNFSDVLYVLLVQYNFQHSITYSRITFLYKISFGIWLFLL